MIQQVDTVEAVPVEEASPRVEKHSSQLTPKVVLSWLPKDATPSQQDSMVRAHIKIDEVTHWSSMPDTLHLPGWSVGKSYRDINLPKYYRESFFSKDSLFHPELRGGRLGVAGDPVPYTVANDNFITSLLLLCFVLACVAYSMSKHFIVRQAKNFFRTPNYGTTVITETSNELRFQMFLVLQTCLLVGLGYFIYSREAKGDTFTIEQYQVISIYAGCVAAYFLLKGILYASTGWVFFDKKKNEQWMKAYLFLVSCEGVLLFPGIMLMAYFGLSIQATVVYSLIVIGLLKILSFYKCYLIFFKLKGAFLHFFLYFCALEMIPLFALWGVLVLLSDYLKINF